MLEFRSLLLLLTRQPNVAPSGFQECDRSRRSLQAMVIPLAKAATKSWRILEIPNVFFSNDRSPCTRLRTALSKLAAGWLQRRFDALPQAGTRRLKMQHLVAGSIIIVLCAPAILCAEQANMIRVGVLKFGTVNWELDTIRQHGLDGKAGINLEVVPLASKSSTQVAIQGGAVDVIVTDWLWVSRQRAAGRDYTFVPYSTAAGSLMVDPDAGIKTLTDLRGKRVGVAGGPLDKSWLLLRAYAKQELDFDIASLSKPAYAAPPLLNELALRKDLPAVLNFWHYSARLKAAGMQPLINVKELFPALGVDRPVPLIGWVFREDWANKHRHVIDGFLQASLASKEILLSSDEEWERLRPLMKVKTDQALISLRDAHRAGIQRCFGTEELEAAKNMFAVLAETGGEALVGKQQSLSEGTFWRSMPFNPCPK